MKTTGEAGRQNNKKACHMPLALAPSVITYCIARIDEELALYQLVSSACIAQVCASASQGSYLRIAKYATHAKKATVIARKITKPNDSIVVIPSIASPAFALSLLKRKDRMENVVRNFEQQNPGIHDGKNHQAD